MTTGDLLARLRALTPTGSVYAVAQLLELPEDTVRNWYRGISYPDALAQTKIAEVLDLPIELVMAVVELARERKPDRRAHWEHLARKFAACLATASVITTLPTDGHGATARQATEPCTNYATFARALRRYLRELLAWRGFALAP